ncbi:phosphomannomutase [Nematocida parisii]|uniref:Phosphomannomutase n=1 Tax=Nematocida parisii (strain ERTm3) TaxID=935791 RepID=I3EGQ1_NEMP3|nr:phosphomannomutase [Nematocida parisii ERTm1]EIJ88398.1 phosphomannomutase [Nematocida parisii ERTm3]KAI5129775.1 phosphomannomutase [Nematocida parisii]EIJ94651.1 phosphomannomutase [Nematocida parisii ERTm1]KAI5129970.1 phosphomannomutase [Nematocida parisii]KAI5142649.1 phosphomannomutase [Nematocida parisii]|eukprot:XP_013058007.1 phosphomannomutase [Nematocida parisii ERTm1]
MQEGRASEKTTIKKDETIFLFDVDGTLSPSRETATKEMKEFLGELRNKVKIGFVGGSDLPKQQEQLGEDCLEIFDYCFPENGLTFIKNGKVVSKESYLNFVGQEKHNKLVRSVMKIFSELPEKEVPVLSGNFIELRHSMVNISPVGRSCTREERKAFKELDTKNKTRERVVSILKEQFEGFSFSIGGEISIDIFPIGWDKTYAIKHLESEGIKHIFFFGDMTEKGGNDFEIYSDKRVTGTKVISPEDTMKKVESILNTLIIE